MNFIRSHVGIIRSPKLKRLARRINVSPAHALGLLTALWHTTWDQTEDGVLRGYEPEDVEDACGWDGEPLILFNALRSCRWLDEVDGVYAVHDWMENSGKAEYDDARRRERLKYEKWKEKQASVSQDDTRSLGNNRIRSDQIREDQIRRSDQIRAREEIAPEDGWMDDSLTLCQDQDQEQVGEDQRPINAIINHGLTRGISMGLDKLEMLEPISRDEADKAIAAISLASRPPTSYGFYATTIRNYRQAPGCHRTSLQSQTVPKLCTSSGTRSTGEIERIEQMLGESGVGELGPGYFSVREAYPFLFA